ncbi:hypothetical protein A6R68_07410 [Neotoma lepida]|uniref:Uncharacterized protein n=1 Tax=Neotoma lepida TaxID=56216 RepID=A0A1A6GCT4_NEOLE|nr:hypothetical protein A6R68_07410 [Neotoma lepida]
MGTVAPRSPWRIRSSPRSSHGSRQRVTAQNTEQESLPQPQTTAKLLHTHTGYSKMDALTNQGS